VTQSGHVLHDNAERLVRQKPKVETLLHRMSELVSHITTAPDLNFSNLKLR
jgi:hypothetical protein